MDSVEYEAKFLILKEGRKDEIWKFLYSQNPIHSFLNEVFQMNFFLFTDLVQPFEFCPPDVIIHNQKWDLRFLPHNRV